MKHVYLDHGNECPDIGDCPFCDGGIKLCTVCGLAEGQLTTDCCGKKVDEFTADKVYSGFIDYVNGEWVIVE